MEETHKLFEPTPPPAERDETLVHEPDRTLVTPRFDEVEAQVARPVVPLAARPARSGRRQWPIALVLISALAGGVVSLLAFRLYQQRQTQSVATQVEGQTPAADATQSPAAMPATTEEQAQSNAPVVFEEFDPAKEGGAISDAAPSQPKVAVGAVVASPPRREEAKAEAKEEPKPAPRAAEPKPRLVETIASPRQVEARQEEVVRQDRRADDEDSEDRRRERRRQRREQRREQQRNIDRIKDIFEGAPPS
jgi:type IV secretory pathway VirB10-like protein